jgi:hypothetical protein
VTKAKKFFNRATRLTKSGKDLSGTGGRILEVSPKELAKHRTRKDAWMAINGELFRRLVENYSANRHLSDQGILKGEVPLYH